MSRLHDAKARSTAQRAVRALGDRVGKDALADLLRDALATLAT
ncbi:MAG TPA: hypothetical protein VHC69_35520 [Polyangiaceae bacterium]|nr:hypothetical protein [Polyangiaceae bacterium]